MIQFINISDKVKYDKVKTSIQILEKFDSKILIPIRKIEESGIFQ